jgi:hypothetical protein
MERSHSQLQPGHAKERRFRAVNERAQSSLKNDEGGFEVAQSKAEPDNAPSTIADWGPAAKEWKEAMNQFAILYADRFHPTNAQKENPSLPHKI